MQALKLVTAPATEPVTLTEAKSYLRIDTSDEDTILGTFISAATMVIENYTNRKFINQTWDLWLDCFPYSMNFDAMIPEGVTDGKLSEYLTAKHYIEIPIYPLSSIVHLKTYTDADVATTMTSTDYIADVSTEPARLSLKNGTTWPTTFLRPVRGIQIQFVAGYGSTAASTPTPIKQAILMLVGQMYSTRGCEDVKINNSMMALISSYVVRRI
jgi:hypothetical protein